MKNVMAQEREEVVQKKSDSHTVHKSLPSRGYVHEQKTRAEDIDHDTDLTWVMIMGT